MGISMAREIVLLQSIVNTSLKNFGYKDPAALWIGEDGDGYTTLFVNYTDATYSTNDMAAFVRLIPAGDILPLTMKTLSHAGNEPINGSVSGMIVAESVTATTGANAKFQADLIHILRGIYGMPVTVALSANGVMPAINGINGAVASTIPATQMDLAAADRGYVGGV